MSTTALLVLTTLGSADEARHFVTGLVADRVVACGVQERHPYEVPELLAVPVERGMELYLSWLTNEVVA